MSRLSEDSALQHNLLALRLRVAVQHLFFEGLVFMEEQHMSLEQLAAPLIDEHLGAEHLESLHEFAFLHLGPLDTHLETFLHGVEFLHFDDLVDAHLETFLQDLDFPHVDFDLFEKHLDLLLHEFALLHFEIFFVVEHFETFLHEFTLLRDIVFLHLDFLEEHVEFGLDEFLEQDWEGSVIS